MQNRNAHLAVRIDVWVPHFGFEDHLRWVVRVIVWELQLCLEVASFVESILRTLEDNVPEKEVVIILKSDGSRDVIPVLAVLQLLGKHLHRIVFVIVTSTKLAIHFIQ